NVQEKDIPVFVNADVKEITEKDGQVNGVKVQFDHKEDKTIKADAVVVTTGGFGANMEMISETNPELKDYVTTNQIGSTGDGIKMIEKLGGYTVDMKEIQIHPTVQQEKSYLIGEVVRGEGAILVSSTGERFVNELDTRDAVSSAVNQTPDKFAYLIFDSGVKERAKAIEQYEKLGFVVEGQTLAELAKEINVPDTALEATVAKWNEDVAAKSDTAFNRTTGMEHDLSKGPYYAIKIAPGIHYTMGGIKVNPETEVLTKEGTSIKGLYAAGELTGGLHGENRIGGNSVAEIIIFGRQAGIKSAEFVHSLK
ncbi:MAG: flavocytochrome c, partial [Carnobacterium maltaromaticum]